MLGHAKGVVILVMLRESRPEESYKAGASCWNLVMEEQVATGKEVMVDGVWRVGWQTGT